MVNEHYVPQAYLRLFAPEGKGLIARYSLVEKHGGGDYKPPIDRYSVRKAAATGEFADELLESDETNRAENAMIKALRKIPAGEDLSQTDIAHLSQFIAFQQDRTAEAKLHFDAREKLLGEIGEPSDGYWESVLAHNAQQGHESLQYMGWRIVENESDVPFITSDAPVVHYFEADRDDIKTTKYQFEGRQIFCPIGPDNLLLLLDPTRFRVQGQFPKTEIKSVTIGDENEIRKFNFLQGVNAFQEIFGPVDTGNLLERTIKALCQVFPDEDYIRGNWSDLETIQKAQELAAGGIETESELEWYVETGNRIIGSRRKKAQAIWNFTHNLSLIDDLQRDNPNSGYWDRVRSLDNQGD